MKNVFRYLFKSRGKEFVRTSSSSSGPCLCLNNIATSKHSTPQPVLLSHPTLHLIQNVNHKHFTRAHQKRSWSKRHTKRLRALNVFYLSFACKVAKSNYRYSVWVYAYTTYNSFQISGTRPIDPSRWRSLFIFVLILSIAHETSDM